MMIKKILSFDWTLYFFWIMATTLGWLIGGFILPGLSLVASGVLVGLFQWLVLQGHISRPWRWTAATFLGWTAGYILMFFAVPQGFEMLNGVVIGLTTGIAQWMILRDEVHWAGWWIIFSIIGWVTGLTLLPGVMLTGTISGALTGLALEILLRNPKRGPIHLQPSNIDRLDL
jgi:hypothetical protein